MLLLESAKLVRHRTDSESEIHLPLAKNSSQTPSVCWNVGRSARPRRRSPKRGWRWTSTANDSRAIAAPSEIVIGRPQRGANPHATDWASRVDHCWSERRSLRLWRRHVATQADGLGASDAIAGCRRPRCERL